MNAIVQQAEMRLDVRTDLEPSGIAIEVVSETLVYQKTSKIVSQHGKIMLRFHNRSRRYCPQQKFLLRVKEGKKLLHHQENHVFGPLGPDEYQEIAISCIGILNANHMIGVIVGGERWSFP